MANNTNVDFEIRLIKISPYLRAKWDKVKKVYAFYYMHKKLFEKKYFNDDVFEKLKSMKFKHNP
jgi:hypothetical protein